MAKITYKKTKEPTRILISPNILVHLSWLVELREPSSWPSKKKKKSSWRNFIQNFHLRTKTLHQYLLCGDLFSTLLLTIPAPSSLTPIACTTEFQLKSAKNQLKYWNHYFHETQTLSLPTPKTNRHFNTIQPTTFKANLQTHTHARTHAHTHKHNFAPGDILAPESLLPRSSRSPSHCRSEVKIAVWHQPTNLGHHKITYPIKKTTHALTTTTVRRMAASGREISRNGSLSQALRVKQAKIK